MGFSFKCSLALSLIFQFRATVVIMIVKNVFLFSSSLYVCVCMHVCLVPDVCDDEIGGRDEEVAGPLEGCASGLVNFSNAGLGDDLRIQRKHTEQTHETQDRLKELHGLPWN